MGDSMSRAVDINGRGVRVEGRGVGVGSAIPDSGGTHQWNFDEGSGTTVADYIGSLDGTVNGATWQTGAGVGDAHLSLDGSNDYIDLPGSQSEVTYFHNQGEGTLAIWIYPEDASSGLQMLYGTEFTSRKPNVSIDIRDGNQTTFTVGTGSGTSDVARIDASYFPPLNEWTFIAGTMDGSTMRLYEAESSNYNLNQIGSDSVSTTGGGDLVRSINIGAEQNGSQRFFEGSMDLPFIDNQGRSESDLQQWVDDTKEFYE